MSIFYSPSTGGFYDPSVHGGNIPVDAVGITDEHHAGLLAGQSSGKKIVADESGAPSLADHPGPTPEEMLAQHQADARAYLGSTDWYVSRMVETGRAIPEDVLALRADARIVADKPVADLTPN